MPKHLFIINKNAGDRDQSAKLTRRIEEIKLLDPYEIVCTETAAAAETLVEQQALKSQGELRVYACGGDATLQSVVSGALTYGNVVVGAIPQGRTNSFVDKIPGYELADFADMKSMTDGEIINIDVMVINDYLCCLNEISLGFDAALSKFHHRIKRVSRLSSDFAYIFSAIKSARKESKYRFSLIADGIELSPIESYLFAHIGSGRYHKNDFIFDSRKLLQDGMFDFICIPARSRLDALNRSSDFYRGINIENKDFLYMSRCRTLKICTDRTLEVNIDGTVHYIMNPEIKVREKALKFILPRRYR